MFDPNLAFEIDDNGLRIEGGPHIIGGASLPVVAPITPTVFIKTNGAIYTHDGATYWKLANQSFSYKLIKTNELVEIPSGQQMIVRGRINIKGKLVIKGQLALVK